MYSLSVIIPVLNEEKTLKIVLQSLLNFPWSSFGVKHEIIVVVDPQTCDSSASVARGFSDVRCLFSKLPGKGAAIQFGSLHAQGDYLCIQDADLEYCIEDYKRFLPLLAKSDQGYFLGRRSRRIPQTLHEALALVGNFLITICLNFLYGFWIYDQACMYKIFPRRWIKEFSIKGDGFEFEIELICKLLKKGIYPDQIKVAYQPRSYHEGKKLRLFKDGTKILWTLLCLRFR